MFFNHVFVVRELVIWFWKFSKITKQSFISKSKPWKLCWNEQEPKSLLRKSMKRLVLPFVKSKRGGIFEGKHHVVSEVVGYSILEVVDNQSPFKIFNVHLWNTCSPENWHTKDKLFHPIPNTSQLHPTPDSYLFLWMDSYPKEVVPSDFLGHLPRCASPLYGRAHVAGLVGSISMETVTTWWL